MRSRGKASSFCLSLRIGTQVLAGKNAPQTVVDFVRHNHITQIFVARSRRRLNELLLGRNYGEAIVRNAHDLQVTVVADRTRKTGF